jgi:hypothetical protein
MAQRVTDVVPGLILGHKSDGRCRYDREAKNELVHRCMEPGVSVAAMALAHGVNANLLRKWITLAIQRRGAGERPVLLPVTMQPMQPMQPIAATPTSSPVPSDGAIELVLPGGTIRVRGTIDAATLGTVIDCLSRRS